MPGHDRLARGVPQPCCAANLLEGLWTCRSTSWLCNLATADRRDAESIASTLQREFDRPRGCSRSTGRSRARAWIRGPQPRGTRRAASANRQARAPGPALGGQLCVGRFGSPGRANLRRVVTPRGDRKTGRQLWATEPPAYHDRHARADATRDRGASLGTRKPHVTRTPTGSAVVPARRFSYRVQPVSNVRGTLTVPGDKSISHRSLMLAGIAEGQTIVNGFLESEDCLATLAAMRALGVPIDRAAGQGAVVEGVGRHGLTATSAPLDMGNSGTAMRLFTGLLAGQGFDSELIGDASLMRRPMERVAIPLRQMGAGIETQSGRPPVRIAGGRHLHGIQYQLPMASAQVKSAILLAGIYAEGTTSIIEPAITRDHSERMLQAFGVDVQVRGRSIDMRGPARLHGCRIDVPGDFSSAAFFIVAGCLAADGV